jgi:hypothetical protein
LKITSRHALDTVDGLTQASKVIPVVRRKLAESGMVSRALVPLNTSAFPYLPAVVQVAFWTVPVFPVPEASATAVPAPSLNEYAATRPAAGVPEVVTLTTIAVVAVLLAVPPAPVAVSMTV